MIHGISYQYDCSWLYLKRRHFCPMCNATLTRNRHEVVVNSESEEAKNYDFSCLDTYMHGNIKFVTFYFSCSKCNAVYEIKELKKCEKKRHRNKKE